MKTFDIRIKNSKGYESVQVSAENAQEARNAVPGSGRVISIKEAPVRVFDGGLSAKDRIVFLERLALMVGSGVGLGQSLDLISKSFGGKIERVSKTLSDRIKDGAEIIPALQSMPEHFPKTTVSLVESGMHGGNLANALTQASEFESEMLEIDRGAKKEIGRAHV